MVGPPSHRLRRLRSLSSKQQEEGGNRRHIFFPGCEYCKISVSSSVGWPQEDQTEANVHSFLQTMEAHQEHLLQGKAVALLPPLLGSFYLKRDSPLSKTSAWKTAKKVCVQPQPDIHNFIGVSNPSKKNPAHSAKCLRTSRKLLYRPSHPSEEVFLCQCK